MTALLAALPVLAVLLLMTVFSWSAARAGIVAAVLSVVLAVAVFDLGGEADGFGAVDGILGVVGEAGFISALIIGIIGPALGIHHLQQHTGAAQSLRAFLARVDPDPRIGALLVAWFFTLFLEGAAGFGTPVALAAPFLVALGLSPLRAVTAALAGHIAGVSFGAIGTPVLAQSALIDADPATVAQATAPYHMLLGAGLVAVVVVLIGQSLGPQNPDRQGTGPAGGSGSSRGLWRWGALAAASFLLPYGVIATYLGPELPTLGGSVVGAGIFMTVLVMTRRAQHRLQEPSTGPTTPTVAPSNTYQMPLIRAGAPYLILILLVVATRLIPPVRQTLETITVEWQTSGGFTGAVQPLYHPAMLLTLSFLAGVVAQKASFGEAVKVVVTATRQLAPVVVALIAVVTVARTMSHAGMTDELASTAASIGPGWPLLAPLVGAFGSFVTGSATSANVLFSELQASTARTLELPLMPLQGAQGFGAAAGNMIAPHNIVTAAATVGAVGQEGRVLRLTLPLTLIYVTLGGGLTLLFSQMAA
ncbi:L-lactate permease [Nesterenkonia alkaliphila]|uniref:L-lactate permease n=2 Tax=Nesterenkonia alkaliphila TaxID=1463631 RepID=A0A7K1UKP0_9MICC|nr:L-lactate permease [Nesterenkonia alkaliphila]MVT27058.1 L-lactate permease [Nesterenkonia alkaliphila]